MIQVNWVESLADVPAAEWDALVSDRSFYLSHAWLGAQDAGQAVGRRYVLARSDGRLVGVLPSYLVEQETNDFYRPECCADGRWQGRYVIAGARRAYTNDLLIADDLPAAAWQEVARALLGLLCGRVAESGRDGALFLYLPTNGARRLTQIYPQVRPVLTAAEATIGVPATFEEYLRTLPRKRRCAVRHEIAVFDAAGYQVGVGRARDHWEEMAPLVGNLQRRYGHDGSSDHWRRLLHRQAAMLDDQAIVFTCRDSGGLVGACLGYPWQGTLHLKMAGFDYGRLRGGFEYFNLAYYQPMRYAVGHGLSRLHLGREAFEAKLRRGARLAPLWTVELPTSTGPAPARVVGWNQVVARRWRRESGWAPGAFSDPGWSEWGCATDLPDG